MPNTIYLELTTLKDLKNIEDDLSKFLESNLEPSQRPGSVRIQVNIDYELVVGLLGWIYSFWTFGKTFFFPEGKFRKPKLLELRRNFQIVTGVLSLKNLLVGLWIDRKAAIEDIGAILKSNTAINNVHVTS